MEPRLIPYALMNMFGSIIVLVMLICCILYERGKIGPRIFKIILAIFATLILGYGVYQLCVADLLQKVYPGKYYTVGGWIAISIGIIFLLTVLWSLRKDKNRWT